MKLGLFFFVLICLSLPGFGQSCTLSVNLTSTGTAVCAGSSLAVTANASGGTAPYTYNWSTGETTSTISVNKAGTYLVTVTDKTAGCPGVKKSITITASNAPDAPTVANVAVCQNTTATLTATAPGGVYQWYDSNGKFLASGATYTTSPINTQTTYYVETSVSECVSPRSTVTVYVYGPPGVRGTRTCQGSSATLTAAGYDAYEWFDTPTGNNKIGNSATFVTPALQNTTTYYVSAIVNGCTTPRAAVTVTVNTAPQAPTASNASVCSGTAATLHATAPAGSIEWYDVPTGGTPLITSPDFTTPALNTTTTYYVQANTGCLSSRTPVTVTINQIPNAPTVQPVSTCPNTSAHLTATTNLSGATFNWYARSSGGTPIANGSTFDTPPLTRNTTFYVDASNGSCGSTRTAVTVTITTPPNAPTAAGALICSGSAAVLTATAPGGTYDWFSAPTGGQSIFTGASYTTPALTNNTTYYVQATSTTTGCISSRTAVTVKIIPTTPAPTAAGVTTCSGTSATLTAQGGTAYQWFDAATAGNLLASGSSYTTPALNATTTYYVQNTANGCPSTRTAVTVTVTPLPATPTLSSNGPVCPGTTATLSATGGGTINWYDSPSGGKLLGTGNTYTTGALHSAATFYADNSNGSCTSPRAAITVNLVSTPYPQFSYSTYTVCPSSPNITPTIFASGGTFSASPAGLVFVSATTGEINVGASATGVYVITYSNGGACASSNTARFAITTAPNATFSYAGPYCQDGANPLPTFPSNSSGAGEFTSSPSGLVFANSGTGEIDLANCLPGTYTITNTILASGGCPASVATSQVTIYQKVIINAGPDQTVASGSTVQLAGSITGGSSAGTWTGGSGTFSNTSSPTATYTPGGGETSAILTLTSSDPPGPCGPQSSSVTITFTPAPPAPTVSGVTICSGSTATLSASAPGGRYDWYTAATGGSSTFTGADFTTPPLSANTTYYVSSTINNVTSARTAVTVTVTAPPAAPVVQATTVCEGSSATLTASGSSGTYNWYSDAAGINKIDTGATFITGALNNNTSFYVQASANGCSSTITKVDVTVSQLPNITSNNADDACSGVPLNYTITSDVQGATYTWSRKADPNINNGTTVSNQTSATITEALLNSSTTAVDVVYTITPAVGTCIGTPFTYTVTVYPTPTVTSAASATICSNTSSEYTIAFSDAQTQFTWGRAAVAGITNAAVTGQTAATLHEVLFNTSNAPVNVTYTYTYGVGTCAGTTFNFVVTVNPTVNITSAAQASACSGIPQNYTIVSNVPSAAFSWSRASNPNINNNASGNGTSSTITETLVNSSTAPTDVVYTITPSAFNCAGAPFTYTVTVNPIPITPIVNSNSPVCVASTIQLRTPAVANASYLWTGPNGYTSTQQNPDITNATTANTGTYQLFVTVAGCASPPTSVDVTVDEPPVANAGPNQTVCTSVPSVQLAGKITGGTTTGFWGTLGTGTFQPSDNTLNAQYIPSTADRTAGSVTLTLMSTSKDDCSVSSSNVVITFAAVPATDAGPDQEVCSQTAGVVMDGKMLIPGGGVWTTSGTGKFNSPTQLNATYTPSALDLRNRSVILKLTANSASDCYIPADSMLLRFTPPPTINAGGTRYVLKGNTIVLNPTTTDENVTYQWSPNININDVTAKNPVITGDSDRVYILTVTDRRGCVSTDSVRIKVSPHINIYNTFTPNGDGVNDTWNIVGLEAYVNAVVDIFNRDGEHLYHSIGYPAPWDGNFNGKPLPAGVYYYIVDTKVNNQKLSGSVTIIR